jgi:hypothetical protein
MQSISVSSSTIMARLMVAAQIAKEVEVIGGFYGLL